MARCTVTIQVLFRWGQDWFRCSFRDAKPSEAPVLAQLNLRYRPLRSRLNEDHIHPKAFSRYGYSVPRHVAIPMFIGSAIVELVLTGHNLLVATLTP